MPTLHSKQPTWLSALFPKLTGLSSWDGFSLAHSQQSPHRRLTGSGKSPARPQAAPHRGPSQATHTPVHLVCPLLALSTVLSLQVESDRGGGRRTPVLVTGFNTWVWPVQRLCGSTRRGQVGTVGHFLTGDTSLRVTSGSVVIPTDKERKVLRTVPRTL